MIFDRNLAVERAGGSEELADKLFAMLLDELPHHRERMEAAWRAGDTATLRHHAHKLHGGAAYTGVPRLDTAAAELDITLKQGRPASDEQVAAVLEAIDALLREMA